MFKGFHGQGSFLETPGKQWHLRCPLKEERILFDRNGKRKETQAEDRGNSLMTCSWSSETGWKCSYSKMKEVRLSLHGGRA